jgi:uncharacterized protein YhaN
MMRLRDFSLDLFGHFTSKTFDFGTRAPGQSDFHVIYGPNEAGKTTTMEAYLRLLYGFPHREGYDFLHQRKNLKVSGTLELDGTPISLARLPVRNGSLRDQNDKVLPEATLQAQLGKLSDTEYRQLLCLDDETIEKGGEEIVNSKGDIGTLLFSAAAGLSDVSGVLDQFREKADKLYRKRASTTEMARLKKELSEVEAQIRDLDVSANAYKKLKHALETAQAEEADVKKDRDRLKQKQAQLEALQNALPTLADIDALDESLAPFSDYPERIDFDPEYLVKLLTRQSQLEADKDRLAKDIARLQEKSELIERSPDHLSLQEMIEQQEQLKSRFEMADLDLGKRRSALSQVLEDMRRAARDLRADGAIAPEKLVLPQAQIGQLELSRDKMRDAARDMASQIKEIQDIEPRLALAEETVAQAKEIDSDGETIGAVLHKYSVDHLVPRYAKAQAVLKAANSQLSQTVAALTYQGKSFTTLPVGSLSAEAAEDLAEQHRSLCDKHSSRTEERDALVLKLTAQSARIDHIKSTSGIVDDPEALEAMSARDQLWDTHKQDLNSETAAAFETAMLAVDQIAEKRLGHAKTLGTLRLEEQGLAEDESRLSTIQAQIADLENSIKAVETDVAQQAQSFGLNGDISPTILAKWIAKLEIAQQAQSELTHLQAEHSEVLSEGAALIDDLRKALSLETRDFDTVVAAARDQDAKEKADVEQRQEKVRDRDRLKADLQRRQEVLQELVQKSETAKAEWSALVASLFDGQVDAEHLMHDLQPLRELRELDVERSRTERQVVSMEHDQKAFTEKMLGLAEASGANSQQSPIEIFRELKRLSDTAQAAEKEFSECNAQLSEIISKREQVDIDLVAIDRQIKEMASIFPESVPTATVQELRDAVGQAQSAITMRLERKAHISKICTSLSVTSLEDARSFLAGTTATDLAASLSSVADDLDAVDARLEVAIEQRTSAGNALRAVTGDSDVAELTERKATLEAEIEDTAIRFLETDFGLRLADEAIRRFRDNHRSGMMLATEKAFAELTNGKYTKLKTRPEGQSEVLLAMEASGGVKQANDMSKGTRFQLYLALRAAAYEHMAAQGTCLPFFCDDIFETFDEDRTRSACRVMERIGRTGQAIYLTHHKHVVDIAQAECGSNVVIHNI